MVNMDNLKKVKNSVMNMINVESMKENHSSDVSSANIKIKFECSDVCSLYPLSWIGDPYDEFIIEHFINKVPEPYRNHLIGFKFDNVDTWANEIKEKAAKNINLMIVGNKTDLTDKIVVTSENATEKAKALEIPIMETSALDSTNVKEAFYQLLREMYISVKDLLKEYEQKEAGTPIEKELNGVALDTKEEKKDKKGGCC